MLIVGRITKDAIVTTAAGERQVVNFSIAINDRYKAKGQEPKEFTLFVNCSYWMSTKVAPFLLKGTLIEAEGRLYLNAYQDKAGEPRASLNCHVNVLKIHGGSRKSGQPAAQENAAKKISDDLPF